MNESRIDNRFTVGGQPDAGDLERLSAEGYKIVVNMRMDNEDDQPLDPAEEGRIATQLGMRYVHIPVSMKELSRDQLDQFARVANESPGRVFAHCRGGTRAGVVVMAYLGAQSGMSGEDTVRNSAEKGFRCPESAAGTVKAYVDGESEQG